MVTLSSPGLQERVQNTVLAPLGHTAVTSGVRIWPPAGVARGTSA